MSIMRDATLRAGRSWNFTFSQGLKVLTHLNHSGHSNKEVRTRDCELHRLSVDKDARVIDPPVEDKNGVRITASRSSIIEEVEDW